MAHVHEILSLDLPELGPYRTLRRHQQHIDRGIFVAEGEKVVRRLLESDLAVVSLLLTPAWRARVAAALATRPEPDLVVYVAPQALLEAIVGFPLHQGIMAVGKVPTPRALEPLVTSLPRPRLLLALDGLSGPENVGVVVRNCAAFGAQAIIVGETSSSPYLRRSVRNSMGTIFQLPVVACTSLAGTLLKLRERFGVRVLAADAHAMQIDLMHADLTGDICLVLGSEATGLAGTTLAACEQRIVIPMHAGTDSLNVANASAVFLYEAMRQRCR
ncbi:MAG: RNA methyltransferase [Planctomycetota bacterium]